MSYSVEPAVNYQPAPVQCDYNFINCGSVKVTVYLSGLNSKGTRPKPNDFSQLLSPDGSVRVTRSYGCQRPNGTRLHRYDRTVREDDRLNTRRGMPAFIPADGDVLTFDVYAFLGDAQPKNCPAGTQATMYQISASRVRVGYTSTWAPVSDASYVIQGRATWNGAVPAPVVKA